MLQILPKTEQQKLTLPEGMTDWLRIPPIGASWAQGKQQGRQRERYLLERRKYSFIKPGLSKSAATSLSSLLNTQLEFLLCRKVRCSQAPVDVMPCLCQLLASLNIHMKYYVCTLWWTVVQGLLAAGSRWGKRGLLLLGMGVTVTKDMQNAKVLSTFFPSVFAMKFCSKKDFSSTGTFKQIGKTQVHRPW